MTGGVRFVPTVSAERFARIAVAAGRDVLGLVSSARRHGADGPDRCRGMLKSCGSLAAHARHRFRGHRVPSKQAARATPKTGAVYVAHPSSDLYGSDLQLIETVRGLRDAGRRVVVCLPTDGPLTPHFSKLGAEVYIVPMPVLRKSVLSTTGLLRFSVDLVHSTFAMRRLLRTAKPAALLVNTVTIPSWLTAGYLAGVPMVCHVHEAEADQPLAVKFALAAPLLLAQRVVTNSEASGQVIRGAVPCLRPRISLVYNGIARTSNHTAVPYRRPDDSLHLVLVGRLSPRKGTDVALEALASVRAAGVDASLTLCGSVFPGYEWFEEQLRDRAAKSDLAGHVVMLGYVASPEFQLDSADVVLVPSRVEPFGNAAVEALLAQRPLVASGTQGLLEIVRPGETGLLVPPGDANALSVAIQSLAADPVAAAALAQRGLDDARERFSVARYRRVMTLHIESVMDAANDRKRL